MPSTCCACSNNYRNSKNVTFHRFPKDAAKCKMWATLCRRLDLRNTDPDICFRKYKLCSNHFNPSDFNNKRLNYCAIPSIFEWIVQPNKNNSNDDGNNSNNSTNNNDNKLETMSTLSLTFGNDDTIPGTSKLMIEGNVQKTNWSNKHLITYSSPKRKYNDNELETITTPSLTVGNEDTTPYTSKLVIKGNVQKTDWSNKRVLTHSPPKSTSDALCVNYESPKGQSSTLKSNQNLPKHSSIKSKLCIILETQRSIFNELSKQFALLKRYKSDNKQEFSSAEHLSSYTLCERFLNRGFSNFLKVRSELTFHIPNGYRYSYKVKQFALMLHFAGPMAYSFFHKSLCLPSPRALKLSAKNWDINPGFNEFLFKVLAVKANTMKPKSKQCVMCVGQMSVKSFLFYNFVKDEIVGFQSQGLIQNCDLSNSVTVIMIHGLNEPWKQLVSYFFSNTICTGYDLKNIIFQCIKQLDTISFNVKIMISDLRKTSQVFAEQLCITPKTPYFNVGSKEIVYMFDPLHLIKATRNHFFKYRFKIKNKIISKSYLTKLYECDIYRQYQFANNLTDNHINPKDLLQKKKVIYAAQVFSNAVFVGMACSVYFDKLCPSAYNTIDFIYFMDILFNTFNPRDVSSKASNEQTSSPYHLEFSNSVFQKAFLSSMLKYFTDLEIQHFHLKKGKWVNVSRKFNTQFVNSWLISIAATIRFHFNISNENQCNVEMYTHKLNRECLDNFFKTFQTENGNCIKPTCNQFKRIFKKLFCADYFEYTEDAHCLKDLDDIIGLNKTSDKEIKIIFPEDKRNEVALPIENISNYKLLNLPRQNATRCICFYLIGQCLKVHQCETCLNFAKSQFRTDLSNKRFYLIFEAHYENPALSYGNLINHNSTFYQYISQLELNFSKHFNLIAPNRNVGKTIKDFLLTSVVFYHPCKNFPIHFLINLYIRLSIYNNLNIINKDNNQTLHADRKIKIP